MTDLGLQRLKEVVTYIETHPEEWDQTHWCGTACCLAGHAQRMAGRKQNTWGCPRDAENWLQLSYIERRWLFSAKRTLADFHAFIAARGIPEDVPNE